MQPDEIQVLATDALNDLKAIDLVSIDIRGLTTIADTMLICTGSSSRHVKSLAQNVITEAKKKHLSYMNIEGEREGEWVIVDLGDVIVHIMLAVARQFYNLEDLWEPVQKHREMKQR